MLADDDPDDADPRHAAQEIHAAACGWAARHGVDLCAGPVAADAPLELRLHAAYHRLACECGAECHSSPEDAHPQS